MFIILRGKVRFFLCDSYGLWEDSIVMYCFDVIRVIIKILIRGDYKDKEEK